MIEDCLGLSLYPSNGMLSIPLVWPALTIIYFYINVMSCRVLIYFII